MKINDMLSNNSFLVNFEATSKKHVLDELAKLAERDCKIDSQNLVEILTKREKLGSTAVGNGIAMPEPRAGHPNFSRLVSISRRVCESILQSLSANLANS